MTNGRFWLVSTWVAWLPLNNISDSFKFIGRGLIGKTGIPFIVVLFIVNFRPQGLFGETELDAKTIKRIARKLAGALSRFRGREQSKGNGDSDAA